MSCVPFPRTGEPHAVRHRETGRPGQDVAEHFRQNPCRVAEQRVPVLLKPGGQVSPRLPGPVQGRLVQCVRPGAWARGRLLRRHPSADHHAPLQSADQGTGRDRRGGGDLAAAGARVQPGHLPGLQGRGGARQLRAQHQWFQGGRHVQGGGRCVAPPKAPVGELMAAVARNECQCSRAASLSQPPRNQNVIAQFVNQSETFSIKTFSGP